MRTFIATDNFGKPAVIKAAALAIFVVFVVFFVSPAYAEGDAKCQSIIEQLQNSSGWGGPQSMAQTMRYIFSEPGVDVNTVRCAYQGSGDVRLTVDVALGAGIPADVVKMGIDRAIKFEPFKKIERKNEEFTTAGRSRFEVHVGGGKGIKDAELTASASGETIRLSGGGGYGMTFVYGYGLNEAWDIEASLEYKHSLLSPEPRSVDGEFARYVILVAMKYRARLTDTSWIKLGLGGGYYMPDALRCTGKFINNTKLEYDDAFGAQVSLEYESVYGDPRGNKTFVVGLKYYDVDYDFASGSVYRGSGPVAFTSLPRSLRILNGNGMDVFFGIAKYF